MKPWRHVYRVNPLRLMVIPSLWLAAAAFLLTMAAQPGERGNAIAWLQAAGFLMLILLPFFLIVWMSRLVLTDDGIEHHQFGYTVRSTWTNIESMSTVRGMEGLYLREPGTRSRLLRRSAMLLDSITRAVGLPSSFGDAAALAEGRFIALTPFTHHWHEGSLKADLQRRAPHLFLAQKP